jgi:hypothetical protein
VIGGGAATGGTTIAGGGAVITGAQVLGATGIIGALLLPGDTPTDTPADDAEDQECNDKPDKWFCEGFAHYEIIGQNKHVIKGPWFTAYGKTEAIASYNWKKKVQASSPQGHTARHIRPRCKKVK